MPIYLRSAFIHDINKFVSSNTSNPQGISSTEVRNTVIWLLCKYFRQVRIIKRTISILNKPVSATGEQYLHMSYRIIYVSSKDNKTGVYSKHTSKICNTPAEQIFI